MDEQTLRAVIDAAFGFIEGKTGNRILAFALREANVLVDAHIGDLLEFLQGKGLVTAPPLGR